MRCFLVIGAMMALVGCSAVDPATPTKVSWQYGAGNGHGVAYPGPAPKFSRAYGWGADQVSAPATQPTMGYAWGADGQTGNVAQTAPETQQRLAAPAPIPNPAATPAQRAAAPGTHS